MKELIVGILGRVGLPPEDIIKFAQGFADALNKETEGCGKIGEVGAAIYGIMSVKANSAKRDLELRQYVDRIADGSVEVNDYTYKEVYRKACRAGVRGF